MVKLSEISEINPKKSKIASHSKKLKVSFVPMADINENEMFFEAKQTKPLDAVFKGYTYFEDGDVLLAKVTPCFENGKAGIAYNLHNKIGFGSSELYVIRAKSTVRPEWIFFNVTTESFRSGGKGRMTGTGGLQRVPKDFVMGYNIPLPPLKVQKQIIAQIEAEQTVVEANKNLAMVYQEKIKSKIAELWGE